MAEVKKPPSFNHSSSSYKHIYDDIFASPRQSRQQQSSNFIEDDYAEMFGSSRSNNGTWSISYSSIPVLDLPPPSEMKVRGASGVATVSGERGGSVDYSGVFGGVGDGNTGLPDGEELFEQFHKKSKTSSWATPRSKMKSTEFTTADILRQSQNGHPTKHVLSQSIGNLHEFELEKNKVAMKTSGEIPKETKTRDYSGVTQKMEEPVLAQTTSSEKIPVTQDSAQIGKDVYPAKKHEKHDKHISMDLGANVQDVNASFLKEPGFSASNSDGKVLDTSESSVGSTKQEKHDRHISMDLSANVQDVDSIFLKEPAFSASNSEDKARDTSPSLVGSTSTFSPPSDSAKHFDHLNNKMRDTLTSEGVCATDAHVSHESTSALHEVDPTQLSHETYVTKGDTETKMDDVITAGKQGKHSRSTSSEFNASKHSSELHAGSQDTHKPNSEAGLSKAFGDDVASTFDVRKKKGRHSRITSLDLGGHKHSHEQDGQLRRNPRFGSSQSFDASHDPLARVKVQPSMMAPSSSVPQFFPVESHYKISKNSSWRNFGAEVYKDAAVSPPSLDEQLDMNSDAGVSVAALQRALEEATMIIQMAKEYLERECQGSSNARFKDTLKVTVAEDELIADEMDKFQQSIPHVNSPPADTNKRKLPFLTNILKVKVAKDNQLVDEINSFQQPTIHVNFPPADSEKETRSLPERTSVSDNGQPSPVYDYPRNVFDNVPELQDQKKLAQDEKCMEDGRLHENRPTADVEKERLPLLERTSLSENSQPTLIAEDSEKFVKADPIFQDRKTFVQDERCIEERNDNMSKLTDERDSQEGGGEWEAAKHLNQLISGVKNKLASFMTWQTDTEKKEGPKETETCRRSQLQSEEDELDSRKVENTEIETTENNRDNTGCPEEHVEIEIGFLSETVEPYENQSFWSDTAGQEKAESSVSLNPVVAASASASYTFSPFRIEEVNDATDTDEEGDTVPEECTEIESVNLREDVLNEMEYEQVHGMCEEQNCEALDDTFIAEDSVEQSDQYRHVDSNIEETNEIMEELCSKAGEDKNEPTEIEDLNRSLDEECRRDAIHDAHCPEIIAESADEDANCEEYEVTKETEILQHDAQILEEEIDQEKEIGPCIDAFEGIQGCPETERDQSQTTNMEEVSGQMYRQNESLTDDTQIDQVGKTEIVAERASFSDEDVSMQIEFSCIEVITEEVAEETSFITKADEHTNTAKENIEDTAEEVAQQAACFATGDDHCPQTENVCLGEAERSCRNDVISASIEEAISSDEMAEAASFLTKTEDGHAKIENEHIEDTTEQMAKQAACFTTLEDGGQQTGNVCLSEAEGTCRNDHSRAEVEEAVSSDEECDRTMEIPCHFSDPELVKEESVLFYDSFAELDGISEILDDEKTRQSEDSVLHSSQSDVYPEKEETEVDVMESESHDTLDNRTTHLYDTEETPNMEEVGTSGGHEVDKCGADAVQRRRRWFDNGVKVEPVKRPSILEGGITEMESDHESLDESVPTGSVEFHADDQSEAVYSKDPVPAVNQDSGSVNSESTPKRRRWSVKIGEEGLPVPPPLFQGVNVNLEDQKETLLHSKSEGCLDKLNVTAGESGTATEAGVTVNGVKDQNSVEAAPRRKRWFGSGENVGLASQLRSNDDIGIKVGIEQESEVKGNISNHKHDSMPTAQEIEAEPSKVEPVNDRHLDDLNRKEKERIAVERAIREARERAFAEAKERARRDASERSNVDARQKAASGPQERVGKVPAEPRASSDKASDAKLRAERAAVERATAEARERALQKALSEKGSHRSREQAGRFPTEKNTSSDPSFQSSSSSSRVDVSNKGEKYDAFDNVSAQRRKERLERRSKTMERPASVLEEKNQRDLLVQKEQAAKNMMADTLDAEVKRWSSGKEGNLRLLLSTLQYILSPESGWQAVLLTDLVEATAVRKAYKKATLCVHPDKLQQRGATIQQKYICERVFDLLKDAWSRLNPDER
ncbi:hypothetical protein vseg_012579 [Gypsophila vaccaria]